MNDSTTRLNRQALRRLLERPYSSFRITTDPDLLSQIQRIVPAGTAGSGEWIGEHSVWVRWTWYFDVEREVVVIPSRGISSNAVLVDERTGVPYPPQTVLRLLRRLLRQPRAMPVYPSPKAPRRSLLDRLVSPAPTALARPVPNDGTNHWATKFIESVSPQSIAAQFSLLTRALLEQFGFAVTTCLPPHGQAEFMRDNHGADWARVYRERGYMLDDPRRADPGSASTWDAAHPPRSHPSFWQDALQHGLRAGWSWTSSDGYAVILARDAPVPSPEELLAVGANLLLLAAFARAGLISAASRSRAAVKQGPSTEELAILGKLGKKTPNKKIADEMGMSPATLFRRMTKMRERLQVQENTELFEAAVAAGWIPAEDQTSNSSR
jgi:hypothetical protein